MRTALMTSQNGWMDSMDGWSAAGWMAGWMGWMVGTVAASGASLDLSPCVLACLPWLPLQAQGSASTRAMAKQSERKRINREAETQRQLKRRRAAASHRRLLRRQLRLLLLLAAAAAGCCGFWSCCWPCWSSW